METVNTSKRLCASLVDQCPMRTFVVTKCSARRYSSLDRLETPSRYVFCVSKKLANDGSSPRVENPKKAVLLSRMRLMMMSKYNGFRMGHC
jgi:hypothetical protein